MLFRFTNPGTLRWGAIQDEAAVDHLPARMLIELKEEVIISSFKTLDGRGTNVHIAGRACLTIQFASNIIVHTGSTFTIAFLRDLPRYTALRSMSGTKQCWAGITNAFGHHPDIT
jgi:hypothetical protein